MQTFLPYDDMEKSVMCLDDHRLGRQCVDAMLVLDALTDFSPLSHHPCVRMWFGSEGALFYYALCTNMEWHRRKGTYRFDYYSLLVTNDAIPVLACRTDERPQWWGCPDVHLSHQANLVRKDRSFYGPLFPSVRPASTYVWPYVRPTRPDLRETMGEWVTVTELLADPYDDEVMP